MPTLLLPAGLIALAALVLPLLVHLARRQTLVPTPFAALRWLRPKARPRRQVRLDEWPLLLLRLLLLGLFALWLAQPATRGTPAASRWSMVVPGVDPAGLPPVVEGEQRRWLAPGWPTLEALPAPPSAAGGVGSLLRQLDMELDASAAITVYVPDPLDGADAERPRLSRAIGWVPVAAAAVDAAVDTAPPRLAIRHDPAHADAMRYLRAAAISWQAQDEDATTASRIDTGSLDAPWPAQTGVLAWLGSGELPDTVTGFARAGGTVLVAAGTLPDGTALPLRWRDDHGGLFAHGARIGEGRVVQLARPLQASQWPLLLDPEFPAVLRRVLQPAPPPARAPAADYAPERGALQWPAGWRDLRGPLLWLILLILAAERWLATSRRRGVAP